MNSIKPYTSHQVQEIANRVWESLDFITSMPGISPLYDIIGSYPILTAEIEGLTFQSAVKFLTSETGQTVPVPENNSQELAGFLFIQRYRKAFYGCILVEKQDSIVRRRFSAAHELGHYLLHFLPLLEAQPSTSDLILAEGLSYAKEAPEEMPTGKLAILESPDQDIRFNFIGDEVVEREANQFAAELLIPEETCRQKYQTFSQKYGTKRLVLTKRLATEFLVSPEAMKWRLIALRLYGN
jgi:Zn-dependent peptidase ImmA (M78 family)